MATKKAKKSTKKKAAPKSKTRPRPEPRPHPSTEARILHLEAELASEKSEHEETKRKLHEALEANGKIERDPPLPLRPKPTIPSRKREPALVGASNGGDAVPADGDESVQPHGPAKLGFRRVDGALVPDEDERRLIRISLKVRDLMGGPKASIHLSERGVMLRGKPWTPTRFMHAKTAASSWDEAAT